MIIQQEYLDMFRDAGLVVSEPYSSEHASFPDGIVVGKPVAVSGNCIPGAETVWGNTGIVIDAPCPIVYYQAGKWIVTVNTYIPGPGPGDFMNFWNTPDEAVADILDYLLGHPERMAVKRREREAFLAKFDLLGDEDSEADEP